MKFQVSRLSLGADVTFGVDPSRFKAYRVDPVVVRVSRIAAVPNASTAPPLPARFAVVEEELPPRLGASSSRSSSISGGGGGGSGGGGGGGGGGGRAGAVSNNDGGVEDDSIDADDRAGRRWGIHINDLRSSVASQLPTIPRVDDDDDDDEEDEDEEEDKARAVAQEAAMARFRPPAYMLLDYDISDITGTSTSAPPVLPADIDDSGGGGGAPAASSVAAAAFPTTSRFAQERSRAGNQRPSELDASAPPAPTAAGNDTSGAVVARGLQGAAAQQLAEGEEKQPAAEDDGGGNDDMDELERWAQSLNVI